MTAWMWALLAAAAWGTAPLIEKAGLQRVAPMTGLFFRSLGVAVGLVFLGLFTVKPQEIRSADARSIFLLMSAGIVASIIGQTFFYNGLKTGEVSRLVPISASYQLIAFILGVILLGESLTPVKAAGAALIMLGVWFLKIG